MTTFCPALQVIISITSFILSALSAAILTFYHTANYQNFKEEIYFSINGQLPYQMIILVLIFGYAFILVLAIMLILSRIYPIFDYKIGYYLTGISFICGIVELGFNTVFAVKSNPVQCNSIRSLMVQGLSQNTTLSGMNKWSEENQCYVFYECIDILNSYISDVCRVPFDVALTLECLSIGFVVFGLIFAYLAILPNGHHDITEDEEDEESQ